MPSNEKPKSTETPITLTLPESKPTGSMLLESFLNSIGAEAADKLTPEVRSALIEEFSKLDLKAQNNQLDRNPKILEIGVKYLDSIGLTIKTPIDTSTLSSETLANPHLQEINERVRAGIVPTISYKSNVGFYGVDVKMDQDNIVYTQGFVARTLNSIENYIRKAGDKGKITLAGIFSFAERKKVDLPTMASNIKELALESHFEAVIENGKVVSIKEKTTDYTEGAMLDDLLRYQNNPYLSKLNVNQAISLTVQMIENVHHNSNRGIGELLANDIVLQVKDGQVVGSRLTLPDMKYEATVEPTKQKALDLLDFCFSTATGTMQSQNLNAMQQTLYTILTTYKNPEVKAQMLELLNQGIPSLTMHNSVRLGFDRDLKLPKEEAFEVIKQTLLNFIQQS